MTTIIEQNTMPAGLPEKIGGEFLVRARVSMSLLSI